jgi:hypothetical protein
MCVWIPYIQACEKLFSDETKNEVAAYLGQKQWVMVMQSRWQSINGPLRNVLSPKGASRLRGRLVELLPHPIVGLFMLACVSLSSPIDDHLYNKRMVNSNCAAV